MKILFDANLSPALVARLSAEYPSSSHVPPKVIWLDVGNAGTTAIEALLRSEQHRVEAFVAATDASLLILSIGASAV